MNYEQKYKESMLIAEHHVMNGSLSKDEAEALFPELRESEEERIRKEIIGYLTHKADVTAFVDETKDCERWIAYLEKQKEQKNPLEGYSRGYNDGYYHGVTDQMQKKQKPAEWSEEDVSIIVSRLKDAYEETQNEMFLEDIERIKSFRPQPHWKPSEEQMEALERLAKYPFDNDELSLANREHLAELVSQLKKL